VHKECKVYKKFSQCPAYNNLMGLNILFLRYQIMQKTKHSLLVDVIIPAYNEEGAIGKVIDDIPKHLVRDIIVCNNGSKDNTAAVAKKAGAIVVHEPIAGYGRACLKGMEYVRANEQKPDVVVFLDGDYSDYPGEMPNLLKPIIEDNISMVIGSRALGEKESGSMTVPQRIGNWLATHLIYMIFGVRFTDLGPFRAIRWDALEQMRMEDKTYGWTVEMQLKAAKFGIPSIEVPVPYKRRIGVSKVSGTIKGALSAGYIIILTILKYALRKNS
jgi:glycosyltransferase involved in cell wall biosynthesis